MKMPSLKATEAQWQDAIVQAAKLTGWLVHAERPAQTGQGWRTAIQGHKGFPDLVLLHPGRAHLVFVELKRKPNKASKEQVDWLAALERVVIHTSNHLAARLMFVPDDVPQLLAFLAGDSEAL